MFFGNDKKKDQNPESKSLQMAVKYKFKDLKVHSSDEWMADGTKKYRKVFDRNETTYMRAELSFYNKLFDEEDWEAAFILKCFFLNGSNKSELCSLEQKRKILKDENVVFIRDAWGNATPGAYWFRGDYVWEAYIGDVKIGEAKFYVEDVGSVKAGVNPYFDIDSIKLFEGDGQGSSLPAKKYLNKFSQKDTRFLWGEFNFKNITQKDYYAEVIFNFYDEALQPKGKNALLKFVAANTSGQIYTLYPGWGSDTPGTWKEGRYTMDVVFMDTLIATVPFEVGTKFEEGGVATITDGEAIFKHAAAGGSGPSDQNKNLELILSESLAELNDLTGMNSIKKDVNELVKLVRFYQETGKDVLNKFSLHSVFTGNPGTGKTTVARILAKIYKGLGILEKGHLIEVDREGLVAGYVGQTAIKTGDKINEAMGGILFIDEAYSLAQGKGSQYDFGGESIQVILKRMEDFRGKFGVIVAGYTDNMYEFITSNPGLKSRFDRNFRFDDYSPEEMFVIALAILRKEDVAPDEASAEHLKKYFKFIHESRDKNFGNARAVRQICEESVKNQNLRLASMKKEDRTKEMLEALILEDVKEFEIRETDPGRGKLGFKFGDNN
ncbi:MAG TPA: AAA family ATPase [Bacteroidia bacterium]